MKKLMLLLVLVLTVGMMVGCSKENAGQTDNQDKTSKKELVVGMELAYSPFETIDKQGNPSGISVDLAKDLGKALGKKVRIENMAYSGLVPSLLTNKLDLIISSMTITSDRQKAIDFSDPYCKAYLALLINQKSPVNKVEDLNQKGMKVAVKKGTTGHIYAKENLPNADILVFDKESACILEVVQGKADAFIYDQMSVYKSWKQYPDSTKVILKPFQEKFEYWGIGMRKGNDQLKAQVNDFLKQYKKDGGFDRLADKYLKEQKKTFEQMGIPFFF